MTRLATRVLRTIRRRRLLGPGDRVALAVSGGSDSVALAFLLTELSRHEGFEVAGLLHLNHAIRGRDADADEQFCRALASRLGLPILTERADVPALARDRAVSLEHAGHDARYAFFSRGAIRLEANAVATGHTMDDQAETVLLRLLRGRGHDLLAGIHPRAGFVIRPLLDVRRAELERFLRERRIDWRIDRSNADPAFLRNRVRLELLPMLRERFAPGIVRALAVAADAARQDQDYLNRRATGAAPALLLGPGGPERTIRLQRPALAALSPALVRRILRWALLDVGGRAGTAHVVQLMEFLDTHADGSLALGRVVAEVTPAELRLSLAPGPAGRPVKAWQWFGLGGRTTRFELPVPGSVELPGGAGVVTVEGAPAAGPPASQDRDEAWIDAAVAGPALFVRFRRAGDRLRPVGLSGRKKLQDLLVDRKVPRRERDRVPLVVSADDRIVWVAGCAVAAEFAVSPATTSVLTLKFRRSGGTG
jgi:tRNA(Ile)-lysidine synthase